MSTNPSQEARQLGRGLLHHVSAPPFAGGGLALDRPVALAAAAILAGPDAGATATDRAVVAKAAEVERLCRDAAECQQRCHAVEIAFDKAIDAELGPSPNLDTKGRRDRLNELCMAVLLSFPELTPEVDAAVAAKRKATEARIAVEIVEWKVGYKRLADRFRYDEATKAEADSWRLAVAAMEELATMQAASLRGILAKASVFGEAAPFDAEFSAHLELAASIVRDLGGAVVPRDATTS